MTPPVTPEPRVSVGMKVVDVADHVIVKVIGLIIFAGSGFFMYRELMSPTTVTSLMFLFAAGCVFGIALSFTRPVVATAASLLSVAGPYIPRFGAGRREDDK